MAVKLTQEALNAAREIFNHPITRGILVDMEEAAINSAINAKVTDRDAIAGYLAEARIIRKFMSRLQFVINETPVTLARDKAEK